MYMFSMLVWLACSSAPTVTSVDPNPAQPGQLVKIFGEDFGEGATVGLSEEDGVATSLEEVSVAGLVMLEGTVPVHISPGKYEVTVNVDGKTGKMPVELVIELPVTEVPCSGEYTANTQVSLTRKEAAIDRFYKNGERETVRVSIDEIVKIEVEKRQTEDQTCSVIWFVKNDGKRLIFADDTKVDLKDRAYKLARDMGKDIADITQLAEPTEPTQPPTENQ
jgi:hypothetical protein